MIHDKHCFELCVWGREWQWQCGSGISRRGRSWRFEWYRWQCDSGSIGGVVIGFGKVAVAIFNIYIF
jgi:hypothetical protein